MSKTDTAGKNGQALMDTSSKCESCKKCLFLVWINYLVHTFCWFETPQGQFPPIFRHLAAMPFPTASSMRSELLSRRTYLFFSRAPEAPPELCAYNSGGFRAPDMSCNVTQLHPRSWLSTSKIQQT